MAKHRQTMETGEWTQALTNRENILPKRANSITPQQLVFILCV